MGFWPSCICVGLGIEAHSLSVMGYERFTTLHGFLFPASHILLASSNCSMSLLFSFSEGAFVSISLVGFQSLIKMCFHGLQS